MRRPPAWRRGSSPGRSSRSSTGAGRLDGTVTLEEFAVWLVRAMDLEACALAADETALDFGDAESIDPDKRPYVSLLASQGILAGDQNGNLSPKSP